ncbi:hypothetical protein [Geminicoccus flavidas]|uniref:hypothetical protein n=1 Tax=Geminicoccus flavidas TaxID=2506407 RepID=UPI00135AB6A5|nr:hypothetical protein [Geminicoccus flavidas]
MRIPALAALGGLCLIAPTALAFDAAGFAFQQHQFDLQRQQSDIYRQEADEDADEAGLSPDRREALMA